MCDHSSPRARRAASPLSRALALPLPPPPPSSPRPTYLLRGSCTATLSCHCVGDATSEASNLILQLRRARESGEERESVYVRACTLPGEKKKRSARPCASDTPVVRIPTWPCVVHQQRPRRRRRRRRHCPRRGEAVARVLDLWKFIPSMLCVLPILFKLPWKLG